ncbi:hypothetical protein F4825DRAFT_268775 [Nemania diffusa]|nr:hypothetical protein F4825DRAFT_268775 [Nemania diffusa]
MSTVLLDVTDWAHPHHPRMHFWVIFGHAEKLLGQRHRFHEPVNRTWRGEPVQHCNPPLSSSSFIFPLIGAYFCRLSGLAFVCVTYLQNFPSKRVPVGSCCGFAILIHHSPYKLTPTSECDRVAAVGLERTCALADFRLGRKYNSVIIPLPTYTSSVRSLTQGSSAIRPHTTCRIRFVLTGSLLGSASGHPRDDGFDGMAHETRPSRAYHGDGFQNAVPCLPVLFLSFERGCAPPPEKTQQPCSF